MDEERGLLNTVKSFATITKYSRYIEDSQSILTSWGSFAAIFIVGVLVILVSLPFASFLLINPKPFCMLFSLGSLILLIGLFQIAKPKELITKAGSIVAVIIYVSSLLLSLYAGLFYIGYLKTIGIIITQVYIYVLIIQKLLSLIYIIVSQFPGGKQGLNLGIRYTKKSVSTFCQGLFGSKKQAFLPL